MRPIDADELKEHKFLTPDASEAKKFLPVWTKGYQQGWNDAIDAIVDNAPTVDINKLILIVAKRSGKREMMLNALRPTGEWINREAVSNTIFPFWERYECNQCHKFNGFSNYCPNCGAKMKGGETNEQ